MFRCSFYVIVKVGVNKFDKDVIWKEYDIVVIRIII